MSPDAIVGTFIVDTCIIINFVAAARLDLPETTLEGRGRWTESAADEINRAADRWPALWTVQVAGWLGEPIAPDREGDTDAVFRLQRQLGGTRREPRRHLAEAEAIHLVLCYPEFGGAIFLTGDRSAADLATKCGVKTWRSSDVLSAAYHDGRIGCRPPMRCCSTWSRQAVVCTCQPITSSSARDTSAALMPVIVFAGSPAHHGPRIPAWSC